MSQTFTYNMKSASSIPLAMACILSVVGGLFYLFGGAGGGAMALSIGKFLLSIAIAYFVLGLLCLFWPKTKFIQINETELRIFYGFPWWKKSFSIPKKSIKFAELVPSPFKHLLWLKIAPPQKIEDEMMVIKIMLDPPLSGQRLEKAMSIKKKNLSLFHFRASEDGANFYIRTQPKGGFGPLLEAIKENSL